MKVIAMKPCFVGGVYRRTGDIFPVDETKFKKGPDGKRVLSKSKNPPIKIVTDEVKARAEAAAVKQAEVDKQKAGAIAASGGAAAKAKADAARDLVG